MSVLNVNQQTFDAEVLKSDVPVLVDFWAPWCGPCRAMTGVVNELAEELGARARVAKVNIDEAAELAARYGVHSIPSFAVIHHGEVQQTVTGVTAKERLREMLEPQMN